MPKNDGIKSDSKADWGGLLLVLTLLTIPLKDDWQNELLMRATKKIETKIYGFILNIYYNSIFITLMFNFLLLLLYLNNVSLVFCCLNSILISLFF